jgi:sigma-E factor negative regulatory protein RseB
VFTLTCPPSRPARQHRRDGGQRRDGRSPLLLAAALAVAVPGLLVTACSGQTGTGTAAARGNAVAAAGRAATAGQVPGPERPGAVQAVRLLAQAARAAIATSYQGEETVTRWNNGSGSVLVSNIWHVSGGQTITQTLDAGASFSSQPYLSSDTDGQAPEGVLGVTAPLVQLLEAHYVVAYAGAGSADNRTAQVVGAWRADGSLAATFWLDDATKLPLEREVFDSSAHLIGRDVFIDVRFANQGPAPPQGAAAATAPPGPWTDPLSHAQLLALRARGWLVPAQLPGGLSLFTGAQTEASTGPVLDLGYSDGLSVVSLFEQRGTLAAELAGWRKTKVDGRVVFLAEPDERSMTWASRGMVYTLMADAPTQTVDAAVVALPHDGPTGFWKRMSRGLVRLASWVNPFR